MLRAIRTRPGITAFLVSLLIIGVLLRTTGNLGPLEDLFYPIFGPVEALFSGIGDRISSVFGGFQDVNALQSQVKSLEAQLNQLTVDEVRVRELEIENSQLRAQLAYKQANPDYTLLGGSILQSNNPDLARVTGQDPSNLLNYVIVDQGSGEGVAVGMPAVTPRGLVGRVTEVGAHWSRVLLIVDPSSSVNSVIQSSRATGVIQGIIGGMLTLKFVPQGEGIAVNDLVLTSGIGGSYPKRLVIGQVVAVQKRDTDLFQQATVKPSVDFNQLEFVLIIKKFTPTDITTEPTPTPTRTPTRTPSPTPSP